MAASNCCAGYSPFPGNINQLVIKLSSYVDQLAKTGEQPNDHVPVRWCSGITAYPSDTASASQHTYIHPQCGWRL